MMGGSLFVSACLLVLAWAAEIVGIFNKNPDSVCSDAKWTRKMEAHMYARPDSGPLLSRLP